MQAQFRPAIVSLAIFTLLTGILYPLAITAIAQVAFPHQANGSLIIIDAQALGSELIGQPFDDPRYFWCRPSATFPYPYNAAASTGSNLGPSNPAFIETVQKRVATLSAADPQNVLSIPVDLVTASASGLDPHISLAAAQYQVARVARARGMSEQTVVEFVNRYTQNRLFGLFGEPRVNVLLLNMALDGIK
jgi:potassium-transporting ATPase KdpC subunit